MQDCQVDLDGCTLTELCTNEDDSGGALGLSTSWWIGISVAVGGVVVALAFGVCCRKGS